MKRKIAIVGPESSGKSTLTIELAEELGASYIGEYAREYIDHLSRSVNFEDLADIAIGQKKREEQAFSEARTMLFCDSTQLTNVIWSYDKFRKCDPWIESEFKNEHYDLYLLCKPDLAWIPDTQRTDEHRREYLFEQYVHKLKEQKKPYKIVEGQGRRRIDIAKQYIIELIENGN